VRAQASRHFQRLQRSRSSGCSTIFFNLFLTLAFLGLQAFKNVLVKKQSKYGKVYSTVRRVRNDAKFPRKTCAATLMGHLPVRMGGSSFHASSFSFFHHQPLITVSRFVSGNKVCICHLMDDLKCESERCMQTESCLLGVLKAPDIFCWLNVIISFVLLYCSLTS
jgi:hypothetical protein